MQDEPLNVDRCNFEKVDQFILDEIDSVPHLEALLLLWRSAPQHLLGRADRRNSSISIPVRGQRSPRICTGAGLIARDHGQGSTFFYDTQDESRNRLLASGGCKLSA